MAIEFRVMTDEPEAVCRWLFEMLGAEPTDELTDLFPGTGAVTQAWRRWCSELRLMSHAS